MPMCVACGMIPIHNPKLNISICPMCDGPVRYSGDSVNNLEILPPLGRPKSKIVQVEIPYSTKLLTQEQETYLNLSMRYITSSGVQRLTPLESSGTASKVAIELPRLILPPTTAPAYIQPAEQPKFTLEELNSMEASMVEQLNPKLDVIAEENAAMLEMEEPEQIVQLAMPQGMLQANMQQQFMNMSPQMQEPMMQPQGQQMMQPQPMMQPQNEVVYPSQIAMPQIAMPQNAMPQNAMHPQAGGNPLSFEYTIPPQQYAATAGFSNQTVFPRISAGGDGIIANPLPGQGGAMLIVDTSGGAMAQLGLDQGGSRRIRRYQSAAPSMGGMDQGPAFPSSMPTFPSGGGAGAIHITKLE